jgi:hypothetical protein
MKNTESTANLLALTFVGIVAVVFMAFVISPILGFGLIATASFVSIL